MKKIALAAALALAATAAGAGELAPMAAEPMEMVMEPAGSGALTWIIPLVAIAAIALAANN